MGGSITQELHLLLAKLAAWSFVASSSHMPYQNDKTLVHFYRCYPGQVRSLAEPVGEFFEGGKGVTPVQIHSTPPLTTLKAFDDNSLKITANIIANISGAYA
jgi:hypothetical protein